MLTKSADSLAGTHGYQLEFWQANGEGALAPASPQFVPLPGALNGRLALPMASGSVVESPPIAVGAEHLLRLQIEVGGDTAVGVESRTAGSEESWVALASFERKAGEPMTQIAAELPLGALAGRTRSFRIVCTEAAAACHLLLFRVCAAQDEGRLNALCDYPRRLGTEVQSFSGEAYTHRMYGEEEASLAKPSFEIERVEPSQVRAVADVAAPARLGTFLSTFAPAPGEIPFEYAMRAVTALLPMTPPDFFGRAKRMSAAKPLRILSICAGAARIEEQILDNCPGKVDITLLDANRELIERAGNRLATSSAKRKVRLMLGDVNQGLPGGEPYDVVICVSALHHVADLECVLAAINDRLAPEGEFWSIGEQIGRNGNRLWPDALAEANRVFGALPEHLRRNAHTGEVDRALGDHDLSVEAFEGIRSEELEALLERYLLPVEVYKRNAFLWRLVDATYADNFIMENPQDLACLRGLVAAEVLHWSRGGRSTELHGVYRKKRLKA